MIAIDLDGTLLSPDGTVSPRNKAAVQRALRAGMLICFATGRNWTESQTVLDAVAHYSTAVFVGGAMVIDTKQRITLHRTAMEPELARQVCRVLEELGHAVLALQDTAEAGIDYLASAEAELNQATRDWMEGTTAQVRMAPRLSQHPHEHTIRVGICAEHPEVSRVQELLKRQFGERILCQSLYVPAYAVEVLEVFDPAVNKWEGVLHVARLHNVKPEEIVAVGDDVNDVPMIRHAGLGVAMGNAKPEVQAVAKRIIGSNDEDGLAAFLDELVARHEVEPMADTEREQDS
jgi:Cof subfamily protein (haloacid dehalogenase superfamily)